MENKAEHDTLTQAIQELSLPCETIEEAIAVSLKLDALVSSLLKTSFAERRVGAERLQRLSMEPVDAPQVLREIGGEPFEYVAQLADELLEILQASVLDSEVPEGYDDMLDDADALRKALYEAFQDLLPSIVGQKIECKS